jgi:hypothetical protein
MPHHSQSLLAGRDRSISDDESTASPDLADNNQPATPDLTKSTINACVT